MIRKVIKYMIIKYTSSNTNINDLYHNKFHIENEWFLYLKFIVTF